ncbi:hypothetical protein ACFFX1_17350 [Dactylosporangium sucinum]|uniref:Uncharacterized protein n=1 Tax=Dactylosporangium sucinum TaxID=1424081 RepID=A0A917X330_9ACTN|nr:hypothetical protein [Dactylosporangium sucinum]GGM57357.1 hypothetical protein GCM10007977_068760 [Dactylosporangium sucinum]
MSDTFEFHQVTANGPMAVGAGATAFTTASGLDAILAELRARLPREPGPAEEVHRAADEAAAETDPQRRRSRLTHLATLVTAVGGLTAIADRIRAWADR